MSARSAFRSSSTFAGTMALLVALVSRSAHAQDADTPQSRAGRYSTYEAAAIAEAARTLGAEVEPHPEGKTIERIETLRLEVFEPRDPVEWVFARFNFLHATSRDYVIRREILQHVGEKFDPLGVDETARNLRQLSQISLVIMVALKGATDDRVRLVAITKDVWSLRLQWNIVGTPGGIEQLELNPAETNIAGTQQTVAADWLYDPKTNSFGIDFVSPRLDGRRLRLETSANIILDHEGHPEGGYGSISIARPLFSTRTEWSWGVGSSGSSDFARRFVNAHEASYAYLPPGATTAPLADVLPYEWHEQRATETAAVTHSSGWRHKYDVTIGAEFNRRAYHVDGDAYDPAAIASFVSGRVPVSDTRVGPFVQAHAYTTDFMRVLDLESLALQEDVNLGYDVLLRLYPVTTALGSSRSFVGTYAGARYTAPLGDGYASASIESTIEAESQRISDAALTAHAHVAMPSFFFGRIVLDSVLLDRYRNYLNRTVYLGGDAQLRGYPSSFYVGKDLMTVNAEFRTRPVSIASMQLGGVVFYDGGDAFNSFAQFAWKHDVGAGVRVLFPFLDRVVFRVDVAKALVVDPGVGPVSYFFTFGQAIGSPGLSPGGATGTGGRVGAIDPDGGEDPFGTGILGQ